LIYEDRQKNLFASAFNNGSLYKLNRSLNKFEVFSNRYKDLISLFEDEDNNLWGGKSGQLIKIDRSGRDQSQMISFSKPIRAIAGAERVSYG